MIQTFEKKERLSSEKKIELLFTQGKSFIIAPFRVVWMIATADQPVPVQILISVSKKKIQRAVDRNLVRRRIREAYRKNKQPLVDYLQEHNLQGAVGFIYTSGEVMNYRELEKKIITLLMRLQKEYEKHRG